MHIFAHKHPIVGMVHLLPLPGSPLYAGSMRDVTSRAVSEASALAAGGVDGLMIENFGDRPFLGGPVGPETVAAMAVAAAELVHQFGLPVGINVLRNDPIAAISIAAAVGAAFVRVNVHVGARVTDQGLLQGEAGRTLRHRRAIGAETVRILADVAVKHSAPLAEVDPAFEAVELSERGLADAVVVSGSRTGEAIDLEFLARIHAAARVPLWAGSGVTAANVEAVFQYVHGAIVGTSVKEDGRVENPVDPARIRQLTGIRDRLFGPVR